MTGAFYPLADVVRDALERIGIVDADGAEIAAAMAYGLGTVRGYYLAGAASGEEAKAASHRIQRAADTRRAAIASEVQP